MYGEIKDCQKIYCFSIIPKMNEMHNKSIKQFKTKLFENATQNLEFTRRKVLNMSAVSERKFKRTIIKKIL